ncbi:MAG: TetR/AcrR family transcriptional regulator [Acidobacteria bacterium]|nr:TetR/AcrR family transcriptional regulator [Acidobacteriota bacterium]
MRRGRKRQFDRQEVVERASGLFWEQGYEATGMTELVEYLGIGRQSLYNTFGDKRSWYLEALRFYFDGRVRLAREIFDRPGPRLERLGELLMQDLLEEAQRLGELAEEASPADLARSLLVMSQGLHLLNQNQRLRDSGVGEAVLRTATAMMRPR